MLRLKSFTKGDFDDRLTELETKLDSITVSSEELFALFSPEIRSQLWKANAMKEKLAAREKYQAELDTKLTNQKIVFGNSIQATNKINAFLQNQVQTLDEELRKLFRWIIGSLVTMITVVCGATFRIGKKLGATPKADQE